MYKTALKFVGAILASALGDVSMAQSQIAPDGPASGSIPKDVRPYFVAFLVNAAEPKEMPNDIFIAHQRYMRRQVESGVYHLVGPFIDGGRIRGMMVLTAGSAEQARAIVEADPAVVEGVLAVEVHPSMFPSLSSLKIEYP